MDLGRVCYLEVGIGDVLLTFLQLRLEGAWYSGRALPKLRKATR